MKKINWVWQEAKNYKRNYFILLICAILISIFNILNAASLKLLLDIAGRESNVSLWFGMLLPILVVTGSALSKGMNSYWSTKTTMGIAESIKIKLLGHMEKMKLEEYQKYHSGDLLNRLSDDTMECSKIFPNYLVTLLIGVFSCLFSFAYAFYLSWQLTIIVIFTAPLVVIWSKKLVPKVKENAKNVRGCDSELKSYSQEQLTNIVTIKTFNIYTYSLGKFKKLHQKFVKSSLRKVMIDAIMQQGGNVIGFISFACTVAIGAYLALRGDMTVGAIVGFAQLLNYIIWPFTELMSILGNVQTALVSADRVKELMEMVKEEYESRENDSFMDKEVVLIGEDISFGYHNEQNLFSDVNMKLKQRQLVGMIGDSGCGKSTFLKLILVLYEPTNGQLYLDIDGERVSGANIRKYISYVPQEHILFQGTIKENICLGEQFTMEQIVKACKKARIHDTVMSLENGYDTMVSEKGGNLSFGQTQRIAIARALIRHRPILLMDEPTASLDKESEAEIMSILKEEAKEKLCMVISHTRTDVDMYDTILLFGDNKVRIQENI